MYQLDCDGENICITGDFMCDQCSYQVKGLNKRNKQIVKKPKLKTAPPKQFKRRKK